MAFFDCPGLVLAAGIWFTDFRCLCNFSGGIHAASEQQSCVEQGIDPGQYGPGDARLALGGCVPIDSLIDVQTGLGQACPYHRQGYRPIDSCHRAEYVGEGCEVADPELFAQIRVGAQGNACIVDHALVCCVAKVAEGIYL
ncbi:hypothetical protein D3C77_298540 [compost metagenome]